MSTLIKPPCCNTINVPLSAAQATEITRIEKSIEPVFSDYIRVALHTYARDEWIFAKLLPVDDYFYHYAKFVVSEADAGPDDQHRVTLYKIKSNIDKIIGMFDEDGELNTEDRDEIKPFINLIESSEYAELDSDDLIYYARDGYYPLIWATNSTDNTVTLYYDIKISGCEAGTKKFNFDSLEQQLEQVRQRISPNARSHIYYYYMRHVIEHMLQDESDTACEYGTTITLSLTDPVVKEVFDFIAS